MLRRSSKKLFFSHEVVWFADGDYERSRFPADLTYFRQHVFDIPREYLAGSEPFHTLLIDLKDDTELMFERLSKTSRNEVRRSSREEVRITPHDGGLATIQKFIDRQSSFNKRKNLGAYITHNQLNQYKGHWFLYNAHVHETWLGHLLLLHDDDRARQWVLASNLDHPDSAVVGYASKALTWHSICDAKAKGFSIYDFGGIVVDENHPAYGITRFKMSFGGVPAQERNSICIPNRFYRLLYRATKGLHR